MLQKENQNPQFACVRCKNMFASMFADSATQAWGCASTAHKKGKKWNIYCGYGSCYDLICFSVVGKSFFAKTEEVNLEVCDICIEEGLHTGEVVFSNNMEIDV